MEGFRKPYRFDGSGILIYAKGKILKYYRHQRGIGAIFIEISLRKAKWLVY